MPMKSMKAKRLKIRLLKKPSSANASSCTDIVPSGAVLKKGVIHGSDGVPLDALEAFKASPGGRGLKVLAQFTGMKMEDKITQVGELVLAGLEPEEIGQKLKLIFSDEEMSKLWGKLKTQIKNASSDEVRKKWETVCEAGKGGCKNLAKNETLALALAYPKDWEHKMVSSKRTIAQIETKAKKRVKMYKGELIQKHGFQEAMEFIQKGKFKD